MEGDLGKKVAFTFVARKEAQFARAESHGLHTACRGVDDATWLHHLHQGDYAHWFRDVIKDADLAEETIEIGKRQDLSARESRAWSKQLLRSATRRQHDPWRICRVRGLILSSGFDPKRAR